MTDTDYGPLKTAALLTKKGKWQVEAPDTGGRTGCWIHDGERHHVADNVGPVNAAFIAAANPQKIINLVDDLAKERSLRLSAEQDLAALRRENEMLRNDMKGDYDLDAWLDWSSKVRKLHEQPLSGKEAETRAAFERWYLSQLSPGCEKDLLHLMPCLFDRYESLDGQYHRPDIELQWVTWKAKDDLDDKVAGQTLVHVLKQKLEDTQRQLGKEQTLQEDGERFRHLMFYHVDLANNGKDDYAVMLTFGPFESNRLRVAVDAERAEKSGKAA
jgi:hypothetical protein